MYDILTLNSISKKIYDVLDENYSVSDSVDCPDAILVRSFNMAEYEAPDNLLAVARAGAGVNNIPLPYMTDKGIVVFNTPGANANAVKELVICGLLLASRDILGGISYAGSLQGNGDAVPKMVEKGKSKFAGNEIMGKTLGIIGLGAIGYKVANTAKALGMKVIGYDPVLPEEKKAELNANDIKVLGLDEVLANADYVTLHVPLLDSTKGMISDGNIQKMKDGVIILNFSRAELASVSDVKTAIANGKIRKYVVDFPTEDALNEQGIITLPHLGASTEEAEDNCAVMAAEQLKDYLENGNIVNSVNFPCLKQARALKHRITIVYNADEKVIESLTEKLTASDTIVYKERGTIGYAIVETDSDALAGIGEDSLPTYLSDLDGVISVRLL